MYERNNAKYWKFILPFLSIFCEAMMSKILMIEVILKIICYSKHLTMVNNAERQELAEDSKNNQL